MASENGEDIMEEMTTGTTELTEHAVRRAAASAAEGGGFFDEDAVAGAGRTGAGDDAARAAAMVPLLPDWVRSLPSAVGRFAEDRVGASWQAVLVALCVVGVPTALVGAAFLHRIFLVRREETKGLLHSFSEMFNFEEDRDKTEDEQEQGPGSPSERNSYADDGEKGDPLSSCRRNCTKATCGGRKNRSGGSLAHDCDCVLGIKGQRSAMTAKSGEESAAAEASEESGHGERPPVPPSKAEGDDSSAGDTDAATGACDDTFKTGEDEDLEEEELEAAPLHLHTLRVPARLRGASTPVGVRSRSSSRSRSNSRDVSPSPGSTKGGSGGHRRQSSKGSDQVPSLVPGESAGTGTGSSASSVVDSEIDPDILLDRAGFEELEPPPPHEIAMGPLASPGMQGMHSSGLLPSVNERMSEETLDDCHAFTDVVAALHSSLRSLKESGEGGEDKTDLLDTLVEDDGEEEDDEGDSNGDADLPEEEKKKLLKKKEQWLKEQHQKEQQLKKEEGAAATESA